MALPWDRIKQKDKVKIKIRLHNLCTCTAYSYCTDKHKTTCIVMNNGRKMFAINILPIIKEVV
jgi:hypothetical protein